MKRIRPLLSSLPCYAYIQINVPRPLNLYTTAGFDCVLVRGDTKAEEDVARSYNLHANCFITKPIDLDQFTKVVKSIEDFWFTIVRLPMK